MNIVRIPDAVRIITDKESILCTKNNTGFSYEDVQISFKIGDTLDIEVTGDQTPIRFIGIRFNGTFEKGTRFLSDAIERGYAEFAFRGMESERDMFWYFIAATQTHCAGYGVKTGCNSLVTWTTDAGGIMLWLDVRCGAKGIIRNGIPFEACKVVNLEKEVAIDKSFDFVCEFCRMMCDNPIFPKNPIYGSNNWYYAYGNSSAKQIMKDTCLLAECTEGLKNRPYMVIDDCWQPLARTHGGAMGRPITCGNDLFPDMKGLADEIRSKNVHPGIWFRPLRTSEKFIDKTLLCEREKIYLDPSCPEVLEMIAEDVERLTGEWGYELIKYDFATADLIGVFGGDRDEYFYDEGWSYRDRSKSTAMIAKDLYRTIYEHSNGAVIIGCNVMGHLAAGYIHIHRSGDDTSGTSLDRTIAYGINTLAFRLPQHKAFFDIDPDCVCITEKLPWEINRRFLELYSLTGTPLFVSVDPAIASQKICDALKTAYAQASVQDHSCRPLDWEDTNIPTEYLIDGERRKYSWVRETGKEFILSR